MRFYIAHSHFHCIAMLYRVLAILTEVYLKLGDNTKALFTQDYHRKWILRPRGTGGLIYPDLQSGLIAFTWSWIWIETCKWCLRLYKSHELHCYRPYSYADDMLSILWWIKLQRCLWWEIWHSVKRSQISWNCMACQNPTYIQMWSISWILQASHGNGLF